MIPRYESKSIFHVGDCTAVEEEMRVFPRGNHDDTLDAVAYLEQIAKAPSAMEKSWNPVNTQ